jgi:hypothetical protein
MKEMKEVKEVIKSVLKDILEIGKIRNQKQNLYYSLLCNTHCDGCGQYNLVSLRGYVRKYCNKTCWYTYDDDTVHGYDEKRKNGIYQKYKYILHDIEKVDNSSLAISQYHRPYYDHNSPSGKVWPMINKPCYNECILKKVN